VESQESADVLAQISPPLRVASRSCCFAACPHLSSLSLNYTCPTPSPTSRYLMKGLSVNAMVSVGTFKPGSLCGCSLGTLQTLALALFLLWFDPALQGPPCPGVSLLFLGRMELCPCTDPQCLGTEGTLCPGPDWRNWSNGRHKAGQPSWRPAGFEQQEPLATLASCMALSRGKRSLLWGVQVDPRRTL
jgi:hypothetical protein